MVKITIIHDWVATFIDRLPKNGYTLPIPHVPSHKMDLNGNLSQTPRVKLHTCYIWSSDLNFYSSALCMHLHKQIADTKMYLRMELFA